VGTGLSLTERAGRGGGCNRPQLGHTAAVKIIGGVIAGASLGLIVILGVVGFAPSYIVLPLFLLMCLGIGLFIAGLRKSPQVVSTKEGSPATAAAMPPGWYPATDGTGRVMWWDGSQWADPPNGSATG
jgi:hypothetical protein